MRPWWSLLCLEMCVLPALSTASASPWALLLKSMQTHTVRWHLLILHGQSWSEERKKQTCSLPISQSLYLLSLNVLIDWPVFAGDINYTEFSKRLWGDIYFNPKSWVFNIVVFVHSYNPKAHFNVSFVSLIVANLPRKLPPVIPSAVLWNLSWNLCIRFSLRSVISLGLDGCEGFWSQPHVWILFVSRWWGMWTRLSHEF